MWLWLRRIWLCGEMPSSSFGFGLCSGAPPLLPSLPHRSMAASAPQPMSFAAPSAMPAMSGGRLYMAAPPAMGSVCLCACVWVWVCALASPCACFCACGGRGVLVGPFTLLPSSLSLPSPHGFSPCLLSLLLFLPFSGMPTWGCPWHGRRPLAPLPLPMEREGGRPRFWSGESGRRERLRKHAFSSLIPKG